MLARSKIADALVEQLKSVDGASPYLINFHKNVRKKLIFWDEIDDFPFICVVAGDETRQYLPSDFKWAFLNVNIKVYVKAEDAEEELEKALIDIERVIDANCTLAYDPDDITKTTEDIRILSISTDEGLLNPIGVGDILLQIRYDL
jgi:hypothetical protein